MPTAGGENKPSFPGWDEVNNVWGIQKYVASHPFAGDEVKNSAVEWTKAIARVTEQEAQTISRYRSHRKRWPWRS